MLGELVDYLLKTDVNADCIDCGKDIAPVKQIPYAYDYAEPFYNNNIVEDTTTKAMSIEQPPLEAELPPPPQASLLPNQLELVKEILVKEPISKTQNNVMEKVNGGNEFTLTKEQADKLGSPFVAGQYIFIELNGQEVKKEWVFINTENSQKLKELLNSDVKEGYYQKPVNTTNSNSNSTPAKSWYQNKWVIVAGCAVFVGIADFFLRGSSTLNGLSGFSKKKKATKTQSNKKQSKEDLLK